MNNGLSDDITVAQKDLSQSGHFIIVQWVRSIVMVAIIYVDAKDPATDFSGVLAKLQLSTSIVNVGNLK